MKTMKWQLNKTPRRKLIHEVCDQGGWNGEGDTARTKGNHKKESKDERTHQD